MTHQMTADRPSANGLSDGLNNAMIRYLATFHHPACVSIYMPAHRAGRELAQDPIRLKNLIRKAEDQLEAQSVDAGDAAATLEPVRKLLDDSKFWRYQSDGLAAFSAPGLFEVFRVPTAFPEIAAAGQRFRLQPLLAYWSGNLRYFLLALSLSNVRLLQGDGGGLAEVACPDLPSSIEDAVPAEDGEKALQFRTHSAGASQGAAFHGQGLGERNDTERLLQFFRAADRAVAAQLQGETAPLLVACLEQYASLYAEVNSYPHLLDEVLPGNAGAATSGELFAQAQAVMERRQREREDVAADRYRSGKANGVSSSEPVDVLAAAAQGRVASVLIRGGSQVPGTWDAAQGIARLADDSDAPVDDLCDLIATQTYLHGGAVLEVPSDRMPEEDAPVAAVFRY